MHKDFHLYGTYIAARCGGFSNDEAKEIACAAQAVDDFTTSEYQTCCTLDQMVTINNKKQINFWTLFHFIPAYMESAPPAEGITDARDLIKLKFKTGPYGFLFNKMQTEIKNKFKSQIYETPYKLAMAGVTMHILADTYAHEGFAGISSKFNCAEKIKITLKYKKEPDVIINMDGISSVPVFARYLPSVSLNLGHGTAGHLPDLSWVEWSKEVIRTDYANDLYQISNPNKFKQAMIKMQQIFSEISGNVTGQINLSENTVIDREIAKRQLTNSLFYCDEDTGTNIFSEEYDTVFADILDDNTNSGFQFDDAISAYKLNEYYTKVYLNNLKDFIKNYEKLSDTQKIGAIGRHPFTYAAEWHRHYLLPGIKNHFPTFPII